MEKHPVALIPIATYDQAAVDTAVLQGVDLLGGIARFVQPEERVLLKPNLLSRALPQKAITTHPAVFSAVCRLLRESGYTHLSYGDSPGNPTTSPDKAAQASGIAEAAKRYGVEMADFFSGSVVPFPDGHTAKSFYLCKGVQDADAIAQQFTQMEQQGETIKTKDAATYADILQQTYGVKKYTGENPYKPYAGHKDPTDIEFDQRVVLTGDGQAAVQEEYSGDISSMTDYLYGLKGDMVAQYSYYETPSKESADKLMEAKAFGNNMVRESDTVIKVVNTGKDMQDLLNTYKGYSVIKDNSVKEYTRMIEETFFSTVCE
mgnify:CR=1 FL=1